MATNAASKARLGILISCLLAACSPPPSLEPAQISNPLTGLVKTVRFNTSGTQLATATADAVAVWDLSTRTQRWKAAPLEAPVRRPLLFFRQADSQLLVIEPSGRILVYDATSGQQLQRIEPDLPEDITAADLDPSGNTLVVAGERSERIYALDLAAAPAGSIVQVWRLQPQDRATGVRIDARSAFLAATTQAGLLVVWPWSQRKPPAGDAAPVTTRRIGALSERYRALNGLASADGTLATVGYYAAEYGDFQIWDVATLQVVQHFSGADPGTTLGVVLDSRARFAVTRGDLRYVLWGLGDGTLQPLVKVYCANNRTTAEAADFAPDGESVALACGSGAVLLDTRTRQLRGALNIAAPLPTVLPFDQ